MNSNLTAGELYPFTVDMDNVSGIAASILNSTESGAGITEKDRIHVKDGHFYTVGADLVPNTADDQRMRFWGTNLSANMLFNNDRPTYDLEKLAIRLKKLGINIVRLNALDSNRLFKRGGVPDTIVPYNSLLDLDPSVQFPSLHQANVADLDRLINLFKSHGIYVDLNFRVSYEFNRFGPDCYTRPGKVTQCLPDPAVTTPKYPTPGVMPSNSRPLDHFNKQMIEVQKWFMEELLMHKNSETGLTYKDDPAVAMMEINNESSLIESYRLSERNFQKSFPPLYAAEFDQLWNDWLKTKYVTTQNLRAAWRPAAPDQGQQELVRFGDFEGITQLSYPDWNVHSTVSNATCKPQNIQNVWATGQLVAEPSGGQEIALTLVEKPCEQKPWYLQLQQLQLGADSGGTNPSTIGFKANTAYQLRFTVRADSTATTNPRLLHKMGVGIQAGSTPVMKNRNITLTPGGRERTLSYCFYSATDVADATLHFIPFIATDSVADDLTGAKIYIDDVSIKPALSEGLAANEGLEAGEKTVSRPHRETSNRCPPSAAWERDYLQFFSDTETAYFKEMYDYLKVDLGVKQPVTGTQATYGGLLGNRIMAQEMDFVDAHFYWDNYRRKRNADGSWYYWIRNTPMMNSPGESVVGWIASTRSLTKPYTISEYGMPNANEFTQESLLIAASYAALQDIDGVFIFTYHTEGAGYDPRANFSLNPGQTPWIAGGRHATLREARKETLMHLAANIFRRGDVAAAKKVLAVQLNNDMVLDQAGLQNPFGIRSNRHWLENARNLLGGGNRFDARIGLTQRVGIVHDNVAPVNQPIFPIPSTPYATANGQLNWLESAQPKSSYLTINTQHTKAISGFISGKSSAAIKGTGSLGQFGTVAVSSMDNSPIATSRQLLVTSIGKVQNARFYLNPRPEVKGFEPCGFAACSTQLWKPQNGPVLVEENGANILLTGAAKSIVVEKLNAQGLVSSPPIVVATRPVSRGYSFDVGSLDDASPWYQVTAQLPATFNLELEKSSSIVPASNSIGVDSTSSGGRYVRLKTNGSVTIPIPLSLFAGEYYVEYEVRSKEYQGAPTLEVFVSTETVSLGTLEISDVLGGKWQRYLANEKPIQLGGRVNQTMRFSFNNDLSGPEGDREIHLDVVRLYPANAQLDADWDGDGIANTSDADNDNDGLTDVSEAKLGTNPYQPDSDGDGVTDSQEVALGTNPLRKDADADADGILNTLDNCPKIPNPRQGDIDNDGIGDACDSDRDGDGSPNVIDCAASDSSIHPEATEIVRDGIDQNCNGFDLTIVITRAQYDAKNKKLDVRAESLINDKAKLVLEGYGSMNWNSEKKYWKKKIKDVAIDVGAVITVSGPEGSVRVVVRD